MGSRQTRLPLQIGIQALFSLAITGGTFVPAFLILLGTLFLLIVKGGLLIILILMPQAWVVAAGAVLAEGALLVYGIKHLTIAIRTRPSDAILDDNGLSIQGGRVHGTYLIWEECKSITEREDDDELECLVITTRYGTRVELGRAQDETERASLKALRETIETYLHPGNVEATPPENHPDLVRCPSCSAPCAPADAEQTTCSFCSAVVPIPASVRERLHAANELLASSKIATKLLPKLLDQPGGRTTTFLSVLAGIPIAFAWLAAVYFGLKLRGHHGFTLNNLWSLSIASGVMVVASYYLMRFWLANRMALSVVTLQFGAFPPVKKGAPWTCRSCSAPLPAARDGLLTRCAWCNSDNVLGVDVRPRAEGARKERNTLETAFARRRADRRRYAGFAAAALALLPLSGWLFVRGTEPLTRESRLAYRCDVGDSKTCLEYGQELVKQSNDEDARRPLQTGCDRRLDPACVELARLMLRSSSDEVMRPVELLQKSCDRDYAAACTELGSLLADKDVSGMPAPKALFGRGCDGGDARGCTRYALALHDDAAALPSLEKACAGHDRLGCAHLGRILIQRPDGARGKQLLEAACPDKTGEPIACNALAEAYWFGRGVTQDHDKAADLFMIACEQGAIGTACTYRGRWSEEKGTKDREVLTGWYRAGCVNDDPSGCIPYSKLLTSSKAYDVLFDACKRYRDKAVCERACDVTADTHGGIEIADIGCGLDIARCCYQSAAAAKKKEDFAAARVAFIKACDLGSLTSCNSLALQLEKGEGGPADEARALTTYQRVCDDTASDGWACAQAARLVKKGGDAARATALLAQSCNKGYQRACPAEPAAPTETP